MTDDMARWRADTPGSGERVHLNNAGAALMPTPVLTTMVDHLTRESQIGGYEAAREAAARVEDAYGHLAALVGAGRHNIAVVENATVAAFQAISALRLGPGDRIVTSRNDYDAQQLTFLSLRDHLGVDVVHAEELPGGGADPESVRHLAAHPRTKLVSITWMPTNSGLVQDVEAIGTVCAGLGIPYLVDACQAVGQVRVDVTRLRCDYLAATGRKFLRGPRGIGFLYVSDAQLAAGAAPLAIDGQGASWVEPDRYALVPSAARFENWEFAYALVLGLGAAARYAMDVGIDRAGERAWSLAARLREQLMSIPGLHLLDRGSRLSAIVTASLDDADAAAVVARLGERRINISVSDRAAALIDMTDKGVDAVIRLSPHYYNTEDEIDLTVQALADTLRGEP